MMHGMTRFAARLFGGRFGVAPGLLVEPREVTSRLAIGEYPTLVWDGPGGGLPIVLLHGLQNSAWIWARAGTLLAEGFPVYAPNMRGHGVDHAPESGYSLSETTLDLLQHLECLGVDRCHLVGHSWGGKIATHFTAHHPERVASLCLADPVAPRGLNGLLQLFPGLIRDAFAPERLSFASEQAMLDGARHLVYLQCDDEVDRRVWREKFRRLDSQAFVPRLPEGGYNELLTETFAEDISELAKAIRCPALLLKPLFSVSFLPGEISALRRSVGEARLKRIPGDHSFIHSNAIDTAAAMMDFFSSL